MSTAVESNALVVGEHKQGGSLRSDQWRPMNAVYAYRDTLVCGDRNISRYHCNSLAAILERDIEQASSVPAWFILCIHFPLPLFLGVSPPPTSVCTPLDATVDVWWWQFHETLRYAVCTTDVSAYNSVFPAFYAVTRLERKTLLYRRQLFYFCNTKFFDVIQEIFSKHCSLVYIYHPPSWIVK